MNTAIEALEVLARSLGCEILTKTKAKQIESPSLATPTLRPPKELHPSDLKSLEFVATTEYELHQCWKACYDRKYLTFFACGKVADYIAYNADGEVVAALCESCMHDYKYSFK